MPAIKIPAQEQDAPFLNREIKKHLGEHAFSPKQEEAILALVKSIASGYQRTISRMEWGPGW